MPVLAVGKICNLDAENCRAKCELFVPGDKPFESYWLPIVQRSTSQSDDRHFWMPALSDEVLVLLDDRREAGFIIGGYYNLKNTPPLAKALDDVIYSIWKDNSHYTHDKSDASRQLVTMGDVTLIADGSVVRFHTTGEIDVLSEGDVTVNTSGKIEVTAATEIKVLSDLPIKIKSNTLIELEAPIILAKGGFSKVPYTGPTPVVIDSVDVPEGPR